MLHSSSPPAALLGVVWNQADLPVRDPEAWDPNVLLEGRAQHYYPNVYSTGQFGGMSLFLEFSPSHRSHSPERTRGHADSPGRKATLLGLEGVLLELRSPAAGGLCASEPLFPGLLLRSCPYIMKSGLLRPRALGTLEYEKEKNDQDVLWVGS